MKTTLHYKEAPACGWYVQVESVQPPPRLEQWGIMLGEVAHHLRSILNTTLTRIVQAEGVAPAKSLQYPVTYTRRKWREAIKRGLLEGVPERVVRAIYACQPWVWAEASGTSPEDNVLAVLAWLNNEDKHRLEIGGDFSASWVAYEGRITTPDGVSRLVRPALAYDWSLTPGSRIVDADTSPYVVASMGRTTLDLQIEVMVPDELGNVTILQELLSEVWAGFQQAQVGLIVAWADEEIDYAKFAGATDFVAGGSFGRAAVDSISGDGVWEADARRRQRITDPFSLGLEWAEAKGASAQWKRVESTPPPAGMAPKARVYWESIRGLSDVHQPPHTWRGDGA